MWWMKNARHLLPVVFAALLLGCGDSAIDISDSEEHDNKRGKPELKYVLLDSSGWGSREVVFDGDTLEPITDPRYMGTYNYVNFRGTFVTGVGHFLFDMLPYYIGGNVRGPG